MYPVATFLKGGLLRSVQVGDTRERPVYFPRLGAYLRELRTIQGASDARWNKQTYAEQVAKTRGLVRLTRQVLLRMEKGQVKDPDPDVLRAFADLYGIPFEAVFAHFIQEKYGVDVSRRATSDTPGDSSDAPLVALSSAVALIVDLIEAAHAFQTVAANAQERAEHLQSIAARLGQHAAGDEAAVVRDPSPDAVPRHRTGHHKNDRQRHRPKTA